VTSPAQRNIGRLSSDSQIRLLTKVARMYHERGIRQADIADSLHLSQARVSRLLKRAAETGIVRTVVVVSQGVHTDFEEALEHKYGLLEAVVVDVDGEDQDIITGLGSAAATYLESTLTGGERIGISSWSQTILAAVDRMRPFRMAGADVVTQLLGGFGAPSAQAKANRLLGELAEIIGAKPTFLPAPGLVGRAGTRSLRPNRARCSPPARSGMSAFAFSTRRANLCTAPSTAASSASTLTRCAPSRAGSGWREARANTRRSGPPSWAVGSM